MEIPAKLQPPLSKVTAAWHAINACQQGAVQKARAQQIHTHLERLHVQSDMPCQFQPPRWATYVLQGRGANEE